uniref:Uncharacterized protein n=1 Tax=Solanum lycopersicum TaxID=4081 RepID=A0A3Q7JJB2_SOLLC
MLQSPTSPPQVGRSGDHTQLADDIQMSRTRQRFRENISDLRSGGDIGEGYDSIHFHGETQCCNHQQFPRSGSEEDSYSTSSSSRVAKGHFVIYTADQARFIIPLAYPETRPLHNFQTSFMNCIISLIKKGVAAGDLQIISLIKKGVAAGDLQRALLLSIPSCCSSTFSLHQNSRNHQILVY